MICRGFELQVTGYCTIFLVLPPLYIVPFLPVVSTYYLTLALAIGSGTGMDTFFVG